METVTSDSGFDAIDKMDRIVTPTTSAASEMRVMGTVLGNDRFGMQRPSEDVDVYLDKSEDKDKWHTVAQSRTNKGSFTFGNLRTGTTYKVRTDFQGKTIENVFDCTDKVKNNTIEVKLVIPNYDTTCLADKEVSQADKSTMAKADICDV